jgi:hypothetical protein
MSLKIEVGTKVKLSKRCLRRLARYWPGDSAESKVMTFYNGEHVVKRFIPDTPPDKSIMVIDIPMDLWNLLGATNRFYVSNIIPVNSKLLPCSGDWKYCRRLTSANAT